VQSFEELRAIDSALHEKETGQPLACERKLIESVRYALRPADSYFVIDEAPDSFGARPQSKPSSAVLPESVLIPDGTWRVHSLSELRQCRVRVEPMHALIGSGGSSPAAVGVAEGSVRCACTIAVDQR
jgi:hypothetical protein